MYNVLNIHPTLLNTQYVSMQARLADVRSAGEQEFLKSITKGQTAWLGTAPLKLRKTNRRAQTKFHCRCYLWVYGDQKI